MSWRVSTTKSKKSKSSVKKTKKTKKTDKKILRPPKVNSEDAKLRKKPVYKSFRLHKPIRPFQPPIATWWELTKMSFGLMWANWRALLSFTLIYGILSVLLVRGLGGPINAEELQGWYKEIFGGNFGPLTTGITTFGAMFNSNMQSSSDLSQMYQTLLLLVASLAIIWLYRQQQAGRKVTIKMAFYQGMYPAIPFFLVMLVISLQSLPGLLGNFIYTLAVSGGLLFSTFEYVLMVTFMLALVLLSLYMISSSVIALYIVTLPEITPLQALREARNLVIHRRRVVFTRFLMLILMVLFILFMIIIPVIFFIPGLANWVFFVLTILMVPFVHGYLFSLYRELLA